MTIPHAVVLAMDQLEGKKVKFLKFPLDKKGNIDVVTNKLILLGKNSSIFFIHVFSVTTWLARDQIIPQKSVAFTKTGCWKALISQV